MRTNVDHPEASEKFSAYRDNELPPDEAAALKAHLQSCASCREQFSEFDQTMRRLGTLAEVSAPPDFAKGVFARVHRRSHGKLFRAGTSRRLPLEWISLIMLLTLLAIYLLFRFFHPFGLFGL